MPNLIVTNALLGKHSTIVMGSRQYRAVATVPPRTTRSKGCMQVSIAFVMPGLVPGIHAFTVLSTMKDVDGRAFKR